MSEPTIPRTVLQDRLDGLLLDQTEPQNPSELQDRLDNVLSELVVGVTRTAAEYLPADSGIVDKIEKTIYAMLLDGIEVAGLAR